MSTTTTEVSWFGWWRPSKRERWKRLVRGNDERTVSDELHRIRRGGDFYTVLGHVDPNRRPKLQRREGQT